MATAYISFCKSVTADTASALLHACKTVVSENDAGKPKWDAIHLSISSGGGNVIAGFGVYNELRGLPVKIITHNVGAVDSIAALIFMAGTERYACAASAFLFHQLTWSFSASNDLTAISVSNAHTWMEVYSQYMAAAIASSTKYDQQDILDKMARGTTIVPQEAIESGLIREIRELSLPQDARCWQV